MPRLVSLERDWQHDARANGLTLGHARRELDQRGDLLCRVAESGERRDDDFDRTRLDLSIGSDDELDLCASADSGALELVGIGTTDETSGGGRVGKLRLRVEVLPGEDLFRGLGARDAR